MFWKRTRKRQAQLHENSLDCDCTEHSSKLPSVTRTTRSHTISVPHHTESVDAAYANSDSYEAIGKEVDSNRRRSMEDVSHQCPFSEMMANTSSQATFPRGSNSCELPRLPCSPKPKEHENKFSLKRSSSVYEKSDVKLAHSHSKEHVSLRHKPALCETHSDPLPKVFSKSSHGSLSPGGRLPSIYCRANSFSTNQSTDPESCTLSSTPPESKSLCTVFTPSYATTASCSESPGRCDQPVQSPNVPFYLSGTIPKIILQAFKSTGDAFCHTYGTLSVDDPGYRRIIREVCGFPSYFGPVLFQRILEAKRIVRNLIRSGKLQCCAESYVPHCYPCSICGFSDRHGSLNRRLTNKEPTSENRISMRDFLRVWDEQIQTGDILRKFTTMLASKNASAELLAKETYCDRCPLRSNARRSVCLDEIRPLLEALVDRHPDLRFLKHDAILRERYVNTALVNIFASLGGLCSGVVSLESIQQSNLIQTLFKCATGSLEKLQPFSVRNFARFHKLFLKCCKGHDSADARCSVEDLASHWPWHVRKNLLYRLATIQTRTSKHKRSLRNMRRTPKRTMGFSYYDFVRLAFACMDGMSNSSIEYWFYCLDTDMDGEISRTDIKDIFDAGTDDTTIHSYLSWMYSISHVAPVQKQAAWIKDCTGIKKFHIKRSGSGPLLFRHVILEDDEQHDTCMSDQTDSLPHRKSTCSPISP